MVLKSVIAALSAALLLGACAAPQPTLFQRTATLKAGMTRAEVVAVMGSPRTEYMSASKAMLYWDRGNERIYLPFVDGRLTSVPKTD
jgi:hypothetical protein